MPEISVIVPVYKVEPYIHKCIDSILGQTFSDYELILVDDGSPDSCGAICDAYEEKDERIRVIHKENGGLSDARNAGMKVASGEYVIFIDSDDYIESDMFAYLYNSLKAADADMATCGIYEVYAERIEAQKVEPDFVCSAEEAFRCILRGHTIRGEIWNKLIKRSCVEGLEFPKGKLYEDIYYTVDMMQRIRTVAVGTQPKYYYLHRTDSITGKAYRPQLFDIIEGYTKNYKLVKKAFPRLEKEAECLWMWSRFIVLDKMLLEDNYRSIDRFDELVYFIRSHFIGIMKNPYFLRNRKISAIVLLISVRLYRKLVFVSEGKKK